MTPVTRDYLRNRFAGLWQPGMILAIVATASLTGCGGASAFDKGDYAYAPGRGWYVLAALLSSVKPGGRTGQGRASSDHAHVKQHPRICEPQKSECRVGGAIVDEYLRRVAQSRPLTVRKNQSMNTANARARRSLS